MGGALAKSRPVTETAKEVEQPEQKVEEKPEQQQNDPSPSQEPKDQSPEAPTNPEPITKQQSSKGLLDDIERELETNNETISEQQLEGLEIVGSQMNVDKTPEQSVPATQPIVVNADVAEDGQDFQDIENTQEVVDASNLTIHQACFSNNLDRVRHLVESENVDVNGTVSKLDCPQSVGGIIKKATALHCASMIGNIAIVEYLISYGAEVDKKASYTINKDSISTKLEDATPLLIAVKCKHNQVVTTLIDAGADPANATASYERIGEQPTIKHTKINALHVAALFDSDTNALLSVNPDLATSVSGEGHVYKDFVKPEQGNSTLAIREANPLKLIILGPPAGGKGTACELIKEKYGVVHLSTGDILRDNIARKTDLGNKVKPFMDEGSLVPDDLIVDLVINRLESQDCVDKGWLLDGFPRTPSQSECMVQKNILPTAVLVLKVDDEIVEMRMGGRRLDPETGTIYHIKFNPPPTKEIEDRLQIRADDTADKIKVRLENYYKHSEQVASSFKDLIVNIDGNGSAKEVGEQISKSIDGLKK
ncbi:adenylate kinase [Acrasis kona]|uniref:Adenylate kinase n=1 Tax=Acrasis kona TaxID=1008807 RepID=A0AAW2ZP18_9EUKA